MRSRKLMLLAAASVAGVLMTAAPAAAEEEPPPGTATVSTPSVVASAKDGTAVVQFHYTCSGPAEATHLYVAVKQGPNVNATDHTSSQYADAYYSTNWSVDQGRNALVCDGTRHKMQAVLKPESWFQQKAPLSVGPAFVQLCLFDSTGLTVDYSMRNVAMTQAGTRG